MSEWGRVRGPRAAMRFVPPFVPITVEIKGRRNNRIEYTWPNEGPAWARPPGGGWWGKGVWKISGRWWKEVHSGEGGITSYITLVCMFVSRFILEEQTIPINVTLNSSSKFYLHPPPHIHTHFFSFLSSPHLCLSADCIDSKWQGLSLSTKHWSHAELTLQVFWLTLSIHRGFDSHQPPWREATEGPEVSGIKRGEEVGTHFFFLIGGFHGFQCKLLNIFSLLLPNTLFSQCTEFVSPVKQLLRYLTWT